MSYFENDTIHRFPHWCLIFNSAYSLRQASCVPNGLMVQFLISLTSVYRCNLERAKDRGTIKTLGLERKSAIMDDLGRDHCPSLSGLQQYSLIGKKNGSFFFSGGRRESQIKSPNLNFSFSSVPLFPTGSQWVPES